MENEHSKIIKIQKTVEDRSHYVCVKKKDRKVVVSSGPYTI